MKSRVVILGNGFDLNIGLPTSYRQFVESPECDILAENPNNYLTNRMINNYRLQGWVDVEEELKAFAMEKNGKAISYRNRFEIEFNEIIGQLRTYLERVSRDLRLHVRKNSLAADFLKVIDKYPSDFDIFSFNYTDLNNIRAAIGLSTFLRYKHVHGSISEKSVVLGFEDNAEKIEDFSFMIKTFNPCYTSHHLRQSLSQAKEIIFFGHSLGSTDYLYFAQFFKEKSKPNLEKSESVKISFITASNESHIAILNQLRNMNDGNTNLLFDQNDIEFYYANDYQVKYKTHYLMRRLELESEADKILNNAKCKS